MGLCLLAAGSAAADDPMWREVRWPFGLDAWPSGRAFRCLSSACGGDVEVYIRAKRGLCANCAAGVTDDAEVDGVADLDMMSRDFVPVGAGERVAFDGMQGRERAYLLQLEHGVTRRAMGVVISRPPQCDLVVIASRGEGAGTTAARDAVRALIAAPATAQWINAQLDGR